VTNAGWSEQWATLERDIAAGRGEAALALSDALIAQEGLETRSMARLMRARAVALSMLDRSNELDLQVTKLQRTFAGSKDPVARLAASQALIDRALNRLTTGHDLPGGMRDSAEVRERFLAETDDWLLGELANELLGAARHLIWSDPLLNGPIAPWAFAVLGRTIRSSVWSLSTHTPALLRGAIQAKLHGAANARLTQAGQMTDAVLERCRSDFSLLAHALLRRFAVMVQQGRWRVAIRTLAAFHRMGEPAIACVVNDAQPARGGGYRDLPCIAAALGTLKEQDDGRSDATKEAIARIMGDQHTRTSPKFILRLMRP
jgi:hypothetical protein